MIAKTVKVTIHLDDPDLDAGETDEAARRLLVQLNEMNEVETAERVLDPSPPEGNKSSGGAYPEVGGVLLSGEWGTVNLEQSEQRKKDRR